MQSELGAEALRAGFTVLAGVPLLFVTHTIGQRLLLHWQIQRRRREARLVMHTALADAYGEFFAVWKTWNFAMNVASGSGPTPEHREKLLERAATAEGKVESVLARITVERRLDHEERKDLGMYRQAFQALRRAIRHGHRLDWRTSEHREYEAFKAPPHASSPPRPAGG
jgi:hypothetical protein